MYVVVLDFAGSVDTLEFNRVDRAAELKRLAPEMGKAVSLIEEGIRCRDPVLIGRGATVSAVANQQLSPNDHFEAVVKFSREADAVGVNIAHSGTVIGMLFAYELAAGGEGRRHCEATSLRPGVGAVLPRRRRRSQVRLTPGVISRIFRTGQK